jgi:hypothetical protein
MVSKLCKSPLDVACEALAVARQRLRPYTHKFSPKKFTQHQLFACLVLKTFLKTDYRGLAAHLTDHSDLRAVLGLATVPHFTTPQKASRRLLRLPVARHRPLRATTGCHLGQRLPRQGSAGRRGLRCGSQPSPCPRDMRGAFLHSRHGRPAHGQMAERTLSAADETAFAQKVRRLWSALASRVRLFHVEAPLRVSSAWAQL